MSMSPVLHHEQRYIDPNDTCNITEDIMVDTSVCTIFILCCLSLFTIPGISISPSLLLCSRAMSIAINVPVRPTPALQ